MKHLVLVGSLWNNPGIQREENGNSYILNLKLLVRVKWGSMGWPF